MFGTTEHRRRSAARAEAALQRATAWLGPSAGPASDGPGPHGLASGGLASDRPASGGLASDGPARDRQTRDGRPGDRPAGLVLTGPAAVAWATGGVAPPVDRAASVDLVWAVISP